MALETLILSIFTAIAGGTIGYLYGRNHAKSLCDVNACGWNISAWKGVLENKFFIWAKRDGKNVVLTLGNNDVDFDMLAEDDK